MTGSVAIQPRGARSQPTRPLIAMKVTLLTRNSAWHRVSSQRLRFMVDSLSAVQGGERGQWGGFGPQHARAQRERREAGRDGGLLLGLGEAALGAVEQGHGRIGGRLAQVAG